MGDDTVFTYRNANKFCMLLEVHKSDAVFKNARDRLYAPNGRHSPADLEWLLRRETAPTFLRHLQLSDVKNCLNYDSAAVPRRPRRNVHLPLMHELLALVNSASDWERALFEVNVNVAPLVRITDALREQLLLVPIDRRCKNALLAILSKFFKYNFAEKVYESLARFLRNPDERFATMTDELNQFLAENNPAFTYESFTPITDTNLEAVVYKYAFLVVKRKPMGYRDFADACGDPLFFEYLAKFAAISDDDFLATVIVRLYGVEEAAPFTRGIIHQMQLNTHKFVTHT